MTGPDDEPHVPRVCKGCGRSTWLIRCCPDFDVVDAIVHLHREHSARPGAFRIICGASLRDEWHVGDAGATIVNCPSCTAILEREARARAATTAASA